MDEIFGRENFVANVIWQKKQSPQNDAKYFSDMHDHILVFAKNKKLWVPNLLPRSDKMNSRYKNPDNDPRGPWTSGDLSVKTYSASTDYEIVTPSGRVVSAPASRCWSYSKGEFEKLVKDNRIWFGKNGDNVPRIKRFLSEVQDGSVPVSVLWEEDIYEPNDSLWGHENGMNNQSAKREVNLLSDNAFSTPKPEKLLQQIITIATKKGDLVLDFFMGSATTQAVSMKMNRHFIGIEQMTYINGVSVPRLKSVIEGEQGGISKGVGWNGGGSFVYAELYELNHQYVAKIQDAQSVEDIEKLIADIKESAFLDYKININRLTYDDSGFAALSLEEQKKILIESLDANQMYLSYSEIDDAQFILPHSVKQFNNSFHQGSKDGGDLA
jgi:adenine-specific DNA-methyltransferase